MYNSTEYHIDKIKLGIDCLNQSNSEWSKGYFTGRLDCSIFAFVEHCDYKRNIASTNCPYNVFFNEYFGEEKTHVEAFETFTQTFNAKKKEL
jgi:hypothetical protein